MAVHVSTSVWDRAERDLPAPSGSLWGLSGKPSAQTVLHSEGYVLVGAQGSELAPVKTVHLVRFFSHIQGWGLNLDAFFSATQSRIQDFSF